MLVGAAERLPLAMGGPELGGASLTQCERAIAALLPLLSYFAPRLRRGGGGGPCGDERQAGAAADAAGLAVLRLLAQALQQYDAAALGQDPGGGEAGARQQPAWAPGAGQMLLSLTDAGQAAGVVAGGLAETAGGLAADALSAGAVLFYPAPGARAEAAAQLLQGLAAAGALPGARSARQRLAHGLVNSVLQDGSLGELAAAAPGRRCGFELMRAMLAHAAAAAKGAGCGGPLDARALDALAEECGGGAVGVMPSPIWRWAQHEAGSSEVAGGGATLRKTNDSPDYSAAVGDTPLVGPGVASWDVRISGANCNRIFVGVVEPRAFKASLLQDNVDGGVLWRAPCPVPHHAPSRTMPRPAPCPAPPPASSLPLVGRLPTTPARALLSPQPSACRGFASPSVRPKAAIAPP